MNVDLSMMVSNLELCEWGELEVTDLAVQRKPWFAWSRTRKGLGSGLYAGPSLPRDADFRNVLVRNRGLFATCILSFYSMH